MDYSKTFTLTIRIDTLYLVLIITTKEDLEYYYFDIKNIFIESYLKE